MANHTHFFQEDADTLKNNKIVAKSHHKIRKNTYFSYISQYNKSCKNNGVD